MSMGKKLFDIYIAAPMVGYETKELYNEQNNRVLELIKALKAQDESIKIFYAGETLKKLDELTKDENEQASHVKEDLENIVDAKYYLMLYFQKSLSSVLVESGWAIAKEKNSLYCVKHIDDLPYLLRNASLALDFVVINEYSNIEVVIEKVNAGKDIFSDFYTDLKKQSKSEAINCPQCTTNGSMSKLDSKILPSDNLLYHCKCCDFTIRIPLLWYEINIGEIINSLLAKKVERKNAIRWAYSLKYSRPSYFYSKEKEDYNSKNDLLSIYSLIRINSESTALFINTSAPSELSVIKEMGIACNNIWVADISDELGERIKREEPNVKFTVVNSVKSIFSDSSLIRDKKGTFDFVSCIKHNSASTTSIVKIICDALKPGGKALIRIPKRTAVILPNDEYKFKNGVYVKDNKLGIQRLSLSYSTNQLQKVLSIIRQRPECINITTFEGTLESPCYYVMFERTN